LTDSGGDLKISHRNSIGYLKDYYDEINKVKLPALTEADEIKPSFDI
jgi:hypothetical protein